MRKGVAMRGVILVFEFVYKRICVCICKYIFVFVFVMRVMIYWQSSRCIGSSCNTASWSRLHAFNPPNTFIQPYLYFIAICICRSCNCICCKVCFCHVFLPLVMQKSQVHADKGHFAYFSVLLLLIFAAFVFCISGCCEDMPQQTASRKHE